MNLRVNKTRFPLFYEGEIGYSHDAQACSFFAANLCFAYFFAINKIKPVKYSGIRYIFYT